MEYWMIIMQLAQTETLPIDKNILIGTPKKGMLCNLQKKFYKYRQQNPLTYSNTAFSFIKISLTIIAFLRLLVE